MGCPPLLIPITGQSRVELFEIDRLSYIFILQAIQQRTVFHAVKINLRNLEK